MAKIDLSFWKHKNVIVTGHSGFKGRWVTMMLRELGAKVTGLALEQSPVHLPEIDEYIIDIRNTQDLTELLERKEPEIILHLAAVSTVTDGLENPVKVYETNVVGTAGLLHAMKSVDSVRAAVIVTSDKSYKNKEWLWGYRENDELGGIDPYSASKAACELVVEAFRQSFIPKIDYDNHKMAIATARCGNLIGGGDLTESRLIPSFARSANSKTPLFLRNPQAVRPWLYVLDALNGYLTLARSLYLDGSAYSGAWNFGPSAESVRCVRDMAESFCNNWGDDTSYDTGKQSNSVEAGQLRLDSSKSAKELRWHPIYDFDKLMNDTTTFYKRSLNGEPMTDLYIEYIRKYFEECGRCR